MLSRTLRRSGHEVAHHGHGKEVASLASLERAAAYMQRTHIPGFHFHNEPHYRKNPLGWAAWNNAKYTDPYAPYQLHTPTRHIDRGPFFGTQFGFAHFSGMKHAGPFAWRFRVRVSALGVAGILISLLMYYFRMWRNGWQWKNRGAVFGTD